MGRLALAGLGWAVDAFREIALKNTLPSYGAGLQFRAIQDFGLNLGPWRCLRAAVEDLEKAE